MAIALIIAIVMLTALGIMSIAVFLLLKKADKGGDLTEGRDLKRTQDFLPFEDISDDIISLGNNQYRAILECSSTNYFLKTPDEKNQIELSFQRFLNTITFPVTFFLQTKTIDNTDRLLALENECKSSAARFPGLADYASFYLKEMASLNEILGNNLQKKRYIIATYDADDALLQLNNDERKIYAAKELRQRCNILASNLDAVGVISKMLSTEEIITLIYSSYYRDDYSYAKSLSDKDPLSLIVHGNFDRFAGMESTDLLSVILGETTAKIEAENLLQIKEGKEAFNLLKDMQTALGRAR